MRLFGELCLLTCFVSSGYTTFLSLLSAKDVNGWRPRWAASLAVLAFGMLSLVLVMLTWALLLAAIFLTNMLPTIRASAAMAIPYRRTLGRTGGLAAAVGLDDGSVGVGTALFCPLLTRYYAGRPLGS